MARERGIEKIEIEETEAAKDKFGFSTTYSFENRKPLRSSRFWFLLLGRLLFVGLQGKDSLNNVNMNKINSK